jgi:hypothetical protein
MTAFFVSAHQRGDHVHANVFAGKDPDHLACLGKLCFRPDEWDFLWKILANNAHSWSNVKMDANGWSVLCCSHDTTADLDRLTRRLWERQRERPRGTLPARMDPLRQSLDDFELREPPPA